MAKQRVWASEPRLMIIHHSIFCHICIQRQLTIHCCAQLPRGLSCCVSCSQSVWTLPLPYTYCCTGETVGHQVHVYQYATEQYRISSTGMQYIQVLNETGRSGKTNNCLLLSKTIIHTHKNCIYTKIQFYCIYPHYRDRAQCIIAKSLLSLSQNICMHSKWSTYVVY